MKIIIILHLLCFKQVCSLYNNNYLIPFFSNHYKHSNNVVDFFKITKNKNKNVLFSSEITILDNNNNNNNNNNNRSITDNDNDNNNNNNNKKNIVNLFVQNIWVNKYNYH